MPVGYDFDHVHVTRGLLTHDRMRVALQQIQTHVSIMTARTTIAILLLLLSVVHWPAAGSALAAVAEPCQAGIQTFTTGHEAMPTNLAPVDAPCPPSDCAHDCVLMTACGATSQCLAAPAIGAISPSSRKAPASRPDAHIASIASTPPTKPPIATLS